MDYTRFALILDGLIEAGRLKRDAKADILSAAIDYYASGQREVFRAMEKMDEDRRARVMEDN